ncbi:LytTR family DNA-binding domain-containing protein [Flavobacterium branchiophilum]|uniref:Two-component system response regulatory protein, LytTR family n=1 Tax=Flavobacterium branchiophilum (strain FL-15) TaxID=1034807 RepID=G2Z1T0_FLABF|nr:LytTR family DNA-binding domain-containing protein [Flavobacterium branchiophilum]CCB69868.1 Two-component system response regulatory protein, LytTR family [Flavobacterium branchiophilum FL-15]
MRAIIIEDEKPAARLLQRKLQKLEVTIETMLHSVEDALTWFGSNEQPDLIFLDIQLSDGLSFEIFEKINIQSAVIFTTAYDVYALKAFKLNSIDYLLKPIDEVELEQALSKFKTRVQNKEALTFDLDLIQKLLLPQNVKTYKKRFTIKIGHQIKIIVTTDIECIFSENKGTYIHTLDNRSYLIDSTLEVLETELDPQQFYRVSRKFIIPMAVIKEIQVHSNSRLKIILPTYQSEDIVVSREKVHDFKNWLG